MNSCSMRFSLFLLLLVFVFDETYTIDNETILEDSRQPRISGRIVKLYSGTRPEPVYCEDEGFQADPANCAVFYRCVRGAHGKYTVFRYQCGPGTVYDPDTEVCNHPQNTKRLGCGGRVASSTEQNRENEVYEGQPEVPSPITTKRQTYIDQTTGKDVTKLSTAHPWPTSSKQHSTVTGPSMSTAYPWMIPSSQTSTLSRQTFTTHQPSSQKGDTCTTDGFMGDSENCRKFYRCVGNQRGGFIRYEFSCSESTIWDDDAQSCNHPWAVRRRRCSRGNSDNIISPDSAAQTTNNEVSQNKNIQQQLQISYGSKISQTQIQISKEPVIQNQTQINYGDPLNQSKNSSPKQNQTQISDGTAFSQSQTQINYGNKGVQTQVQVDHTKQASQTQTQIYESSSRSTSTSRQQDEIDQGYGIQTNAPNNEEEKDNKCSESGFMGDKNDCKKFYRCVDNGRGSYTKYDFSCGDGTVWDPNIEACNHVWAVKECGGKVPAQSSIQSETTTISSPKTTTTSSTQNYYTTSESMTTENEEDVPYGNHNQQPTTTSASIQPQLTTTASTSGTICTLSGFIGDLNDCKKFYRCVDNGGGSYTKYEFKCGEGTVWDPDIEACNHAWAVKKCSGHSTENTSNVETTTSKNSSVMTTVSSIQTTTQISIQTDDNDTGYGQAQNEFPSTTTAPTKPQSNGVDECKSSGFIGDNNNCKTFYRCVDNGDGSYTRYEFSCGEGTVWDPKIEACNHAWAVEKCGGSNTDDIHKETTSMSNPILSDEANNIYTTESGKEETTNPTLSTISSTSSTTASEISHEVSDGVCVKEGFVGDPIDCKKFYRCVENQRGGYIKYEFSCGEGTLWDSEINACNHRTSVKTPCSTSSENDNFGNSSQQPTTEYTTQTTAMESTKQPMATEKPVPTEECSHEGFFGNKNDCKKFYRCVNNGKEGFTKYDFVCGDGTIWDQEIQACNHESSNTNCSKGSSGNIHSEPQSDNSDSNTSASYSTTEEDKQTTPKTETSQSSSRDQCTTEGFFANSNDCKKFFRCVDNGNGGYTKYDFNCGEGTIWVQDLQTCDHDNDGSSCSKQSQSTVQTIDTEQPTTASSTSFDTTLTQPQKPNKEDDEYPSETSSKPNSNGNECSSEGFFGNKNDCKRFYRCVDNGNNGFTKYDFTCGEGTAWDSNIQTCNHINKVQGCQDGNQQESESEKPIMQDEESTQSTDNNSSTQTTTSGSSTEASKPSKKDSCEQEGFYGNTQDCKKFYRCVDNGKGGFTKYDYTCGEGTIWDQDITTCNHPQDVSNPSCQQSDGSTSSTTSSSSSSSSTSQSTSSTTENNNQGNCSQEDSSKPANQNVTCDKAGFYANPNDCKKFYRCVDWDGDGKRFSVYHFDCGEGTIWDPALDTCNHEESVYPPRDCSGSQSQNENENQGTTTTDQSTSTETTTTQQTTSTEQATEQTSTEQTTSEQTTAQQTTISDQTTTQQTTTSEQTTTQQSTTSEETTTQQSTTSEQTTTQQTTTSEQTTTQQSTTNEQTTTQQSTTSEQSTTQQSTTSEQTTTQQTTSSEQTTEQDTTTTEQTTAQETTDTDSAAEQTTTEQSTTEQTTTQQSTIGEETTQQQSDQNTTTEESDQQNTTEQSTTNTEESTEQLTTSQTESESESSSTTESTSETESETEESTSTTEQQHGENSTTQNESETTTQSQESTTESSPSSNEDCPETEDDQHLYVCPTSFRRHPKYCNLFYQCDEDDDSHEVKVAVFNCPNNTIYDESKTKCVEESKADKKCDGEIAQRRRVKRLDTIYKEPIEVSKDSLKCPTVGYFPFEKEECSPAFLKCQKTKSGKIRGLVYKCPEGYVYWTVSKRCEATSNVRFCNKSYNDWRGRWEIPIERRNIGK